MFVASSRCVVIMKSRQKLRKREENKRIALERIQILKNMIKKEPDFAERYEQLIKLIEKKYRLR